MDINSLRLEVLSHQQSIAKLQLERQKLLVKIAEDEQDFVKKIRSAENSEDRRAGANMRLSYLSKVAGRHQNKIQIIDKKIHLETQKLSSIQHRLERELKRKHLETVVEERKYLASQDKQHRFTRTEYSEVSGFNDDLFYGVSSGEKIRYSVLPHKGKFHIITGVNGLGKSRYLRFLSDHPQVQDYCQRIICLSGTMYDRFPRKNETSKYLCECLYFGNRVNGNILSEKAPFRILSEFILGEGCNGLSGSMAGNILAEIGFSRRVRLVFSPRVPVDQNLAARARPEPIGLTIELANTLQQSNATEEVLAKVRNRDVQLQDMIFEKGLEKLGLSALSSGERLYLLSTLALCFCVTERTLVLFDEPENSLHPQWQAKIIKDMVSIVREMADECTVVIATHSPLIVSSAPNDISFIRDLPSSEPWLKSELYGRNADTILSEQFGLNSPRSLTVASLIQECLTALTDVHRKPEQFLAAADSLLGHNIQLDENDPLHDTIKRIELLREKYA